MKLAGIGIFFLILFSLVLPATWAAPFSDLPADHWATEAVKRLSEKGLVEGYPDGAYRGIRAASRYEMAMVVARLVAKMETMIDSLKPPPPEVTREDLDTIRALVNEFKNELDALGVRVTRLEDMAQSLQARVQELEKVKIIGAYQSVFSSQGLTSTDNRSQAMGAADFTQLSFKPYNAPVMTSGSALTMRGRLETVAALSPQYAAGLHLGAYNATGFNNSVQYYGVTAPYLNNSFTGNANNLTVTMDQAWVRHHPTNILGIVGEFNPTHMADYMLKGQPNPSTIGPSYLPLYGIDISRKFVSPFFVPEMTYEILGARLPGNPYANWLWGAHIGKEDKVWKGGINYYKVSNDEFGAGFLGAQGLPFGPTGAFTGLRNLWTGTGIFNPQTGAASVGPQTQDTWGLDLSYTFKHGWKASVLYSGTNYQPTRTNGLTAADSLFSIGASGPVWRTALNVEYFSVGPKYDPFVAPMNLPVASPTLFYQVPYFTVYNGFYQLHDTIRFPNNRQGIRADLTVPLYGRKLSYGQVTAMYQGLEQVRASTLAGAPPNAGGNLTEVGFTEHFFDTLPGQASSPTVPRGRIDHWAGMVNLNLPYNFKLMAGHFDWNMRRNTADFNNIELKERVSFVNLTYPLKYTLRDKVNVEAGFVNVDVQGKFFATVRDNFDFVQSAPVVGVTWKHTNPPDTGVSLSLRYKFLNQRDRTSPTLNPAINAGGFGMGDWNGTQAIAELKWEF
ncbi:MAG: S-layer homology domain-containing protein [Armatimonadetes bacterium]|nr:S-layer homology domain-containing protein [Armatimonadota bacterium]